VKPPLHERGAALLSVLLLVAVMAVMAAVMLDRLNLATHLASNGQAMTQARLAAASVEGVALARIKTLVDADQARTVDRSGLLGRPVPLTVGRAQVEVRIEDAGNCFNVNSLVEQDAYGVLTTRPAGVAQLPTLMATLDVPAGEARSIGGAMADWIDSDQISAPGGAEDAWYRALPVPYRTAGRLATDVSEMRGVKGMTAPIYQTLRPWLCALPVAALSPVNINTLRPDQARLLTMLDPAVLPLPRARAVIAGRPADGYADAAALSLAVNGAATGQIQRRSRWFLVSQVVTVDRVQVEEQALVDVALSPPRVAARAWGGVDSR